MKRRKFWPALLALIAAPKALIAKTVDSGTSFGTPDKAWFCALYQPGGRCRGTPDVHDGGGRVDAARPG